PEKFDLERTNATKTLAFGKGIHYCLGAALGKLEAEIALEGLTRRFPRLRLVDRQPLSLHAHISFRGPPTLWVRAAPLPLGQARRQPSMSPAVLLPMPATPGGSVLDPNQRP